MLPLLALCACSGHDDDVSTPSQESVLTNQPKTKVRMSVGKAAPSFQEAGIESLTVYVYKVERKGSVLYDQKTVDVANASFAYELPLGDTYQTFAVANVASVTDAETLETVALHVNPSQEREVWMSNVVRFAADKSVEDVELLMKRLVAEVSFSPAETVTELAAFTQFDRLDVTFNHMATTYHVKTESVDLENLTLTTMASEGYQTRFFTFDTTSSSENGSVFINYLKGATTVNSSSSQLDAGVKYAASHRYALVIPVTNNDFVATPWAASSRAQQARKPVAAMTVTDTLMED